MGLANLFAEAGFVVEECKPLFHIWPPRIYRLLASVEFGYSTYCLFVWPIKLLWIDAFCNQSVRIVAKRPIAFCTKKPLEK